ncbi:unnamed protein product [Thlaspi arvense]|uniref:Uncharacterized protein n=1 Tax=Thlaspi arvense TaxID=13288 RepID=A0AAU9RRI1_THLAR|nr:unnamed protein product [Thlaspi arvense]
MSLVYARNLYLHNVHSSFCLEGSGFILVDVDELEIHKGIDKAPRQQLLSHFIRLSHSSVDCFQQHQTISEHAAEMVRATHTLKESEYLESSVHGRKDDVPKRLSQVYAKGGEKMKLRLRIMKLGFASSRDLV